MKGSSPLVNLKEVDKDARVAKAFASESPLAGVSASLINRVD
jgi:hypothetical protein